MKLTVLFAALLPSVQVVAGHYMTSNFWVNGVDQGMGRCMRTPMNTNAVMDFRSNDMACNVNGDKGVARVCEIDAGDTLEFVWRAWPDGREPGSVTQNHEGPCAAYLKKAPGTGVAHMRASGGGWFKIFHDGYKNGAWCSKRIRDNGGRMKFTIPTDLAAGEYLLRVEHMALHQAYREGGIQPYIGCAQVLISSNGQKTVPSPTVSIPGYFKVTDPGVLISIYETPSPVNYVPPGPKAFLPAPQPGRIQNHLKEKGTWDCIITNANYCVRGLKPFTTEEGCWDQIRYCYKQLGECYNQAPVTGNKGCEKTSEFCHSQEAVCKKCLKKECVGSFKNPPILDH